MRLASTIPQTTSFTVGMTLCPFHLLNLNTTAPMGRIVSTTAAAKSEYDGKTYYFCAPGCKKSFDHELEKYAR